MSAFVVTQNHINAIVTAMHARRASLYFGHNVYNMSQTAVSQQVAEILWKENIRSVQYRYPRDDFEYGEIKFQLIQKGLNMRVGAIMKALDCLEYQSCETADWDQSEAFKIIRAMKECLIREIDGYEEAEWAIA